MRGVGKLDDDRALVVSYVLEPLLVWNHHRMIRGCERGLRSQLEPVGQPSAASTAS